jgi:hypothetical protein
MDMLRRIAAIVPLSLLVVACETERKPAATPIPTSATTAERVRDSSTGTVVAVAVPDSVVATAGDTIPTAKRGTARGPKRAPPDSAVFIAVATQPKSRTRGDSISLVAAIRAGLKNPGWPVHAADPLAGSLLPQKRIVAFYGNPLSKRLGMLGEIPYTQMLAKLDTMVDLWRAADPSTPVIPALHVVVSVAQGAPGKDGMYRQRSDPDLIEKMYGFAKAKNGITILDIQTGWSTLQEEIPALIPFLSRPDVHLGIDPEFNMHHSREHRVPSSKIGTFDAGDVNYAISALAQIVTKYRLPPKILVVHRFTTNMVQHADRIKLDPRVQVVMDMDGWGQPWHKFDTYKTCEVDEPVQFTGFKLFFHNDTKLGDPILSAKEVLHLLPRPLYIQYQ